MRADLASLNLNHLYYFHVVANEGSLAAAARKLNLTQSTVSEQLKQLEGFLDAQLFDRKGGRLRLNDAGRQALDQTTRMFESGERLLHQFRRTQSPDRMTVEVGVTSSVSRTLAAHAFLPLFRRRDVLVRVRHGDYDYLLHDLLEHGLDVLVSDTMPSSPESKGMTVRELHRPRLVPVAAPDMAARVERFPNDLAKVPFVTYTMRSKYRWNIEQLLRADEERPELDVIGEVDDVEIQRAAAVEGLCAAFLPRLTVRDDLDAGRLVSLDGIAEAEGQVCAVYLEKRPTEHVIRALEDMAAHFGESDA